MMGLPKRHEAESVGFHRHYVSDVLSATASCASLRSPSTFLLFFSTSPRSFFSRLKASSNY
ncbi:UNVERIFIED_CONTAM: hypothetical protein NCL1_15807 [Trichonephila clavipes]